MDIGKQDKHVVTEVSFQQLRQLTNSFQKETKPAFLDKFIFIVKSGIHLFKWFLSSLACLGKWAFLVVSFIIGAYVGTFYLASQIYQNRINIIENRANAVLPLLGITRYSENEDTSEKKDPKNKITNGLNFNTLNIEKNEVKKKKPINVINVAIAKMPSIQRMEAPLKPLFWDYKSIYDSLLSRCNYHEVEGERRKNGESKNYPWWFDWTDQFWNKIQQFRPETTKCKPYFEVLDQLKGIIEILKDDLTNVKLEEVILEEADLSYANLKGANLFRAELKKTNLFRANLKKSDLRFTNLNFAELNEAKLQNVDLRFASLQEAKFYNANLQRGQLNESDALKAVFLKTNLQNADLQKAKLDFANFSLSNIQNANFQDADLMGASFSSANLQYANFQGADLIGANFENANLQGAFFKEAKIDDVNLQKVGALNCKQILQAKYDLKPKLPIYLKINNDSKKECIENYEKKNLKQYNFEDANLSEKSLKGASLKSANLRGANLTKSNLSGAYLHHASFENANLKEANLSKVEAKEARFSKAQLANANLQNSSLSKAYFDGANFQGANLSKANFEGASLFEAKLDRANLTGASLKQVGTLTCSQIKKAKIDKKTTKLPAHLNVDWKSDQQFYCGIRYQGETLSSFNFYKANLQEADLYRTTLLDANLILANLQGAKLIEADLKKASLISAKLQGADFSGADLTEANLFNAKFQKANMENANLKNADLLETNFLGSKNLTCSQLQSAYFYKDTKIPEYFKITGGYEEEKDPKKYGYLKDYKCTKIQTSKTNK